METLVIQNSRPRYVLLLLACIGFVAAGSWMVMAGEGFGWVAIVFFGAGIPVFIWQLVDPRPRLIIDAHGVLDRTLGVGRIAWSDIKAAYVRSISGSDFICLELKNPEKYAQQLSTVKRVLTSGNRLLGFANFNLNLSGVDASTDEVFALVMKYCRAAAEAQPNNSVACLNETSTAATNKARYEVIVGMELIDKLRFPAKCAYCLEGSPERRIAAKHEQLKRYKIQVPYCTRHATIISRLKILNKAVFSCLVVGAVVLGIYLHEKQVIVIGHTGLNFLAAQLIFIVAFGAVYLLFQRLLSRANFGDHGTLDGDGAVEIVGVYTDALVLWFHNQRFATEFAELNSLNRPQARV